jgi:hypothetical protein
MITKVRETVEVPVQSAQVTMIAEVPETVEVPPAKVFDQDVHIPTQR